jgi:hypothetical protein
VQESALTASTEAHFPPLQPPLAQSLSAEQVAPTPSSAMHVPPMQRAPERQPPVHASPSPGSATQTPDEHAATSGSHVIVVALEHAAPTGWRTTWTHIEFTQLAPAVAPPLTGGSAHDEYVRHAPPGGTTPLQTSSHVFNIATRPAASVPAQSAARSPCKHRPAVAASHVAPSAAALFPRVVTSAAIVLSQAGSEVPPDDSQHRFMVAHQSLAKRAGKSAAETGVPPDELPPPQPAIGEHRVTATRRNAIRIAALSRASSGRRNSRATGP